MLALSVFLEIIHEFKISAKRRRESGKNVAFRGHFLSCLSLFTP